MDESFDPTKEVLNPYAELPPRDPFLEMLRPILFETGNPAAAATGSGLEEGFLTGQASVLDRLKMLASYFGNALPSRGGIEFGRSPGLRAYLERWLGNQIGDTAVPGGTRLPPTFGNRAYVGPNVRPPTVEPGGAGVPGVLRQRPERLERLLSEDPRQQLKDLQLYKKLLDEGGGFLGVGTGQYGPGIRVYNLPKLLE